MPAFSGTGGLRDFSCVVHLNELLRLEDLNALGLEVTGVTGDYNPHSTRYGAVVLQRIFEVVSRFLDGAVYFSLTHRKDTHELAQTFDLAHSVGL